MAGIFLLTTARTPLSHTATKKHQMTQLELQNWNANATIHFRRRMKERHNLGVSHSKLAEIRRICMGRETIAHLGRGHNLKSFEFNGKEIYIVWSEVLRTPVTALTEEMAREYIRRSEDFELEDDIMRRQWDAFEGMSYLGFSARRALEICLKEKEDEDKLVRNMRRFKKLDNAARMIAPTKFNEEEIANHFRMKVGLKEVWINKLLRSVKEYRAISQENS